MPIECSIVPDGGEPSIDYDFIEAGNSRMYRNLSQIGKIIVITCFSNEISGRVSQLDEDQIIFSEEGPEIPNKIICEENSETLYPDIPISVPVKSENGEKTGNMVINLFLPMPEAQKYWLNLQVG